MRSPAALPAAALALAAIAAAACAAPGGKSASVPTPAAADSPRVTMPSGAVYTLELALTPEEQAQGLMFRESLSERTGMLFLFKTPGVHKFWMKNTMIPLDIIWMDGAGRVLFVSANTPPCRADPCANYGPDAAASSVLEIAGAMAAKEKIVPGSVLRFTAIPSDRSRIP